LFINNQRGGTTFGKSKLLKRNTLIFNISFFASSTIVDKYPGYQPILYHFCMDTLQCGLTPRTIPDAVWITGSSGVELTAGF
jgi:hypothetical protein